MDAVEKSNLPNRQELDEIIKSSVIVQNVFQVLDEDNKEIVLLHVPELPIDLSDLATLDEIFIYNDKDTPFLVFDFSNEDGSAEVSILVHLDERDMVLLVAEGLNTSGSICIVVNIENQDKTDFVEFFIESSKELSGIIETIVG